jgi:outer membrane protein assembly factor BamD (BamD/ComL family)
MRNTQRWIVLSFALALTCAGCASSSTKKNLEAGFSELGQQHYDLALAAANKQLQESPRGPGAADAWYLKGRAYEGKTANNPVEAKANLTAARDAYHQALQLNPSAPMEANIRAGLANVSYWLDDYATAQNEWTRAYPRLTEPAARSYTLYRIGLSQQRLGQFAQADETFNRVQREYPNTDAAEKAQKHLGYKAFLVQLATYQNPRTADSAVDNLRKQGAGAQKRIDPAGRTVVSIGPAQNYSQAIALRDRFAGIYPDALIVP